MSKNTKLDNLNCTECYTKKNKAGTWTEFVPCALHKPEKPMPRNICKNCRQTEFYVRYTECAVARISGDGDTIDDGHNMQSYDLHFETASCAECDKPHKWKD